MDLIQAINSEWDWSGLKAVRIEARNAFGNVIVEDDQGRFWRILPEELSATVVAADRDELRVLTQTPEFCFDWSMTDLVYAAVAHLGEPGPDEAFYLVIPAVLGGTFSIENIRHIGLEELLRLSGDLGRQIQDLPDGAQVSLTVID